jgi:hypothetical protein
MVVGRRESDENRRQKTALVRSCHGYSGKSDFQVGSERSGFVFDDRPRCDCISREMNSR